MLLLWIALHGSIDSISGPALAWIHLVAIGWFSVAALAVLLHVIPGFTDLRWRFEGVARASLGVLAVGVVAFALSLFAAQRFAGITAVAIAAALLCYVSAAWATLAQTRQLERTERAIARAISLVLVMLVAVAAMGVLLALDLSGSVVGAWIARLPAAHANLGFYGWLSLLVYGVSVRTVLPICGATSRFAWMHVLVGTSTLVGASMLAAGLAIGKASIIWPGAVLVGVGAVAYAADVGDIVRRATTRHRPPQAFVAVSVIWLLVAVAFGASVLAGRPFALAYGFLLLVGWVGQIMNAHMLHLGTRVIATVYRGDDDETRPSELLDVRLSWTSFVLFQGAVAFTACGLAFDLPWSVACGAIIGAGAWIVMTLNLVLARGHARNSHGSLANAERACELHDEPNPSNESEPSGDAETIEKGQNSRKHPQDDDRIAEA